MHRDIDRLSTNAFDILVVGGGICGLIIACDAAERGLSVALVEQRDFGSGASFNHLRTIHGGLRYLQSLDVARARESIRERRTIARIAEAAVRPLPFVLPLRRSLMRGKLAMRSGFLVDRLIAGDRNRQVPASHQLPAGHVLDRARALERYPELRQTNLTGAAVWYDYVTIEPDRLTLAWAIAAADNGAVLANYVEGTALAVDGRRVVGLKAVDRVTGRTFDIRARLTVNATGGALDRLLLPLGLGTETPIVQAMNLVTRRPTEEVALGALGRTGRNFFMVPWRGRAVFGTWESPQPRQIGDIGVREAELTSFIDELNHAFPSLALGRQDVTLVHRGMVPAMRKADGTFAVRGADLVADHADRKERTEGLVSVAAVKYTTARVVAERVTTRLVRKLGRKPIPPRTARTPLPISAGACDADLRRAAQDEMVITLEDALVRRTPVGALGYPGDEAAERAAAVVGSELGWDRTRQLQEVEALRRFYDF
jgi:glycerol-3-phosphate dehydrogenase